MRGGGGGTDDGILPEVKECRRCHSTKVLSEFHRSSSSKDGRVAYCKPCRTEQGRAQRESHPDRFKERDARKRAKYAQDPDTRRKASEQSRQWRQQNPERVQEGIKRAKANRVNDPVRNRKVWLSNYGLTPEKFDELNVAQGGVCAICREPCARYDRLSVDHRHESGRLRGLLCDRCNRVLGLVGDNPALLDAALAYLHAGGVIATVISVKERRNKRRTDRGR